LLWVQFYRPFGGIFCSIYLEVVSNIHLRNVVKFLTDLIRHSKSEHPSSRISADSNSILEDESSFITQESNCKTSAHGDFLNIWPFNKDYLIHLDLLIQNFKFTSPLHEKRARIGVLQVAQCHNVYPVRIYLIIQRNK
jgi:hypothetical protein